MLLLQVALILMAFGMLVNVITEVRKIDREIAQLDAKPLPSHSALVRIAKERAALGIVRARVRRLGSIFIALMLASFIATLFIGCGTDDCPQCGGYYGERAGEGCFCFLDDEPVWVKD